MAALFAPADVVTSTAASVDEGTAVVSGAAVVVVFEEATEDSADVVVEATVVLEVEVEDVLIRDETLVEPAKFSSAPAYLYRRR